MVLREALKEVAVAANSPLLGKNRFVRMRNLGVALGRISDIMNDMLGNYDRVKEIAPEYDLDSRSPGNGYRSFISLVDKASTYCQRLSRNAIEIDANYSTLTREANEWILIFEALHTCLNHLQLLVEWGEPGSLFAVGPQRSATDLLTKTEQVNPLGFYGMLQGYQFAPSMRQYLKFVSAGMAAYSDIYFGLSAGDHPAVQLPRFLAKSAYYLVNHKRRRDKVISLSRHASVEFIQSFWFVAETDLYFKLISLGAARLDVLAELFIPPVPVKVGSVTVQPGSSHGPSQVIHARLMSSMWREGMIGSGSRVNTVLDPPSPCLIFQVHGGGFIAQSSKSHASYLRRWTKDIGVPMVALDYSLAPLFPYPRALEEVVHAYAWCIENKSLLGWTGERVVFVGDSAGGNLLTAATLKCIHMGLPLPSGLFLAYTPFLLQFVPSPSRLLCLADPLLPFGFMMKCLQAYAGTNSRSDPTPSVPTRGFLSSLWSTANDVFNLVVYRRVAAPPAAEAIVSHREVWLPDHSPVQEFGEFCVPADAYISPYLARDSDLRKFPKTILVSSESDPCLDDCVMFGKRLKAQGRDVELTVFDNLPHGFLCFGASPEATKAVEICGLKIRDLCNH